MGRKKTRAADIKRRLAEDDQPVSPFASIRLVEKKEPEKKKAPKPAMPKKPSEIVQGYDPSSSFADILYSYEHTGNPYTLPSASKKRRIAESKTDFGAILDKWEGRTPEKRKAKASEAPKSVYTPTRSFADILSSYEGKAPSPKKEEAVEKVEDIADDEPLFRKESEDEKRSPEASWSIFGGNDRFVRSQITKEDDSPAPSPEPGRASKPYEPTKSFADILASYEGHAAKKQVGNEMADEKPHSAKPEVEAPLSESLFRKESEGEKRSPDAVWSVFGNNAVPSRSASADGRDSHPVEEREPKPYRPKGDFSRILSDYERKSEKTFDEIMREKGDEAVKRSEPTISKLRTMMPQSTLDLHGCKVGEAESRVRAFLDECEAAGLRKISIITGKGLHSEDGIGVLRDAAIRVLDESGIVSEKASAPQSAGGSGALWIILKAQRSL